MNDSMVDRLDDQEPVTITEALDIPQPRAVGSPLPRGNGNRVSLPPTYAELEDRSSLSHPGPVLAPLPPLPIAFASPVVKPASTPAANTEPIPVKTDAPAEAVPTAAAPAPIQAAPAPPMEVPPQPAPRIAPQPPVEHRAPQVRAAAPPSTLQRAAGVIRHAIPVVQKLLPLLDGNFGTVVSSLLNTPAPPAPTTALAVPPPPPPKIDLAPVLTPIRENIAELKTMHSELQLAQKELQTSNIELRDRISEQNTSLKRVEDHLELVREATDRNTLEQQELMEDLKAMGSRVNVVAAVAIGLLAISLLVNMFLFMHIQRVLP